MWSLFSRDPLKEFGYEIQNEVIYSSPQTIWNLHKGKKKATGDLVSVFVCIKENKLALAKAAVKRFKTLRHPCILTYMDSLETETSVYLVTELVQSLEKYLETNSLSDEQKMFTISWGLHQISKGTGFLLNDCNLAHNNICLSSIFVTRAGEWSLAGLEYVNSAPEWPSELYHEPTLAVYRPPEAVSSSQRTAHKWSGDSWGLGCLLWEVFNGPLSDTSSLKSLGKIPKALTSSYCELVGARPEKRPSPSQFLSLCRSGFMKNPFVDTLLFLEEIQVKESQAVTSFFTSLVPLLDSFPNEACKHKILPQMINAFEFGSAGSSILGPIFKLGKLLDEEEYQKKIVPCVVKLFSSKDRSTRAKLLQQMQEFVGHLNPSLVNDQIFPQVAQGFLDTNPTIREQTVKCILHLAPKLNYNNLNDEVMKHFARLQVKDEQGGIRTNTTVCLGKIAPYLHPQVRQKVLISAFARAMRDPFPPARIAGVVALASTQAYYTLQDSSKKVLPVLCPLTVDTDKSVRDQAFKAVKGFLSKLEKASEDPSLVEQMEAEVNVANSGGPSSFVPSWAGWAVNSIAAKFYKSNIKTNPSVTSDSSNLDTPTAANSENASPEKRSPIENSISELNLEQENTESQWDKNTENFESWGNDTNDWNDDGAGWEDFEIKGITEDSSFDTQFAVSQRLPKSVETSDWDTTDWSEGASLSSPKSNIQSKSDDAQARREEKRLQRQKEIQEKRANRQGGPMKLGARKMQ